MPGIGEALENDWDAVRSHLRALRAQPQPSFTPAEASQQSQPEVPAMSNAFTELQHLLAVADEDAIHAVNVVLSHPEGIAAISAVAALAGFSVPPGTITTALGGVAAILGVIAPQQPPQQQQQAAPADAAQARTPQVV